ncbi:MAG: hypothetical protein KIG88_11825 [Weeksellaceae bacterium]|nr:hypothetical protein [Weeksellaceae bacterium]
MKELINKYVDKLLHFAFSFIIMVVFDLAARLIGHDQSIPLAAILTMFVGIAKELYDEKEGGLFDGWDLLADFIGVALAIAYIIFAFKI